MKSYIGICLLVISFISCESNKSVKIASEEKIYTSTLFEVEPFFVKDNFLYGVSSIKDNPNSTRLNRVFDVVDLRSNDIIFSIKNKGLYNAYLLDSSQCLVIEDNVLRKINLKSNQEMWRIDSVGYFRLIEDKAFFTYKNSDSIFLLNTSNAKHMLGFKGNLLYELSVFDDRILFATNDSTRTIVNTIDLVSGVENTVYTVPFKNTIVSFIDSLFIIAYDENLECRTISSNELLWKSKFKLDENSIVLKNLKCVENGNLFFAYNDESEKSLLTSLNLLTGKNNWITPLAVDINQIPAIDDKYIYVVGNDHKAIVKVDKFTGSVLKEIKVKGHYIQDSLKLWNGNIYFSDINGGIFYVKV